MQLRFLLYSYFVIQVFLTILYKNKVDSRYLDFAYPEQTLISKWKSDPCFNLEI